MIDNVFDSYKKDVNRKKDLIIQRNLDLKDKVLEQEKKDLVKNKIE